MPSYRYKAVDAKGHLVRGHIVAFNEGEVEEQLDQRGLCLIQCSIPRESTIGKWIGDRGVKARAIIEFYYRFSQTLDLGLPVLNALEENSQFLPSIRLRKILGEIKASIEGGRSLYDAMSRFPKVFKPLDLAIVNLGEQSGELPKCLKDVAEFHEWRQGIKSVLKKATIYPAFILLTIVAVIGVWVGYVLPQMVGVIKELGVKLPSVTMTVLQLSNLFRSFWLWFVVGVLVGIGLFVMVLKTEKGGRFFHKHFLNIPFAGKIAQQIALTRLCHHFATMFSAGMLLGGIFETLSRNALGNRYLEDKLRAIHRRIEQGEPISLAFENVDGFPSLLLGALRNGETTGTLDKTLNRLGDYYDTEVKRSVQSLVSAIEPMTIIILGGVFGLIVLSILLPLYDVVGEFGKAY